MRVDTHIQVLVFINGMLKEEYTKTFNYYLRAKEYAAKLKWENPQAVIMFKKVW